MAKWRTSLKLVLHEWRTSYSPHGDGVKAGHQVQLKCQLCTHRTMTTPKTNLGGVSFLQEGMQFRCVVELVSFPVYKQTQFCLCPAPPNTLHPSINHHLAEKGIRAAHKLTAHHCSSKGSLTNVNMYGCQAAYECMSFRPTKLPQLPHCPTMFVVCLLGSTPVVVLHSTPGVHVHMYILRKHTINCMTDRVVDVKSCDDRKLASVCETL